MGGPYLNSGSGGNIFGYQSQIIRAGFHGERDAALLGFVHIQHLSFANKT